MIIRSSDAQTLYELSLMFEHGTQIEPRTARYVNACIEAINDGGLPIETLSVRCPECGRDGSRSDDFYWEHFTDDRGHVLVGCEGYWTVNPLSVGVESPGWEPSDNA